MCPENHQWPSVQDYFMDSNVQSITGCSSKLSVQMPTLKSCALKT